MIERDGWFWCSGCGKNIWRTDQTFALEGTGVPSEHGSQENIVGPQNLEARDAQNEHLDAFPGGTASPGGV